jgi:hypothetical protein
VHPQKSPSADQKCHEFDSEPTLGHAPRALAAAPLTPRLLIFQGSLILGLEDLIKNERRPFLASVPDDPWGSPYRYEVIGENPRITSNGPDKKAETPDDIYMDASNQ